MGQTLPEEMSGRVRESSTAQVVRRVELRQAQMRSEQRPAGEVSTHQQGSSASGVLKAMNSILRRIRMVALAASFLCSLATVSCCTATNPTKMNTNAIHHLGTQDYEAKVKTFKVQPDEARNLLADFIRNQRTNSAPAVKVAIGQHSLIVGNAYHFYNPTKTKGIPLSGYYVDGNTGKVEFRKVEGSVPYPKQK